MKKELPVKPRLTNQSVLLDRFGKDIRFMARSLTYYDDEWLNWRVFDPFNRDQDVANRPYDTEEQAVDAQVKYLESTYTTAREGIIT